MADKDGQKRSGLAAMLMDPLNWALLILALGFAYYVMMVPYWQNYYLKEDPQVLTLQQYMDNPTHPRPPMLRTLGAPPASIEVIIEPLTVKHIDTDSITLTADPSSIVPPTSGPCDTPPMIGAEQDPPLTDILVAGDNMDLLEVSEGQQVALQVFGLFETDLGWIPLEPSLDADQEERFSKEELDALEYLKILANGNEIEVPYVESGEFRLASGLTAAGELHTLEDITDDTDYIQTRTNMAGATADIWGVRLVGREQQNLAPYFIVEDAEGRRARVFYNQRLLSEWRWALDRLEDACVVVRGRLRQLTPPELRQLDADGNIQAMIDGESIMSPDGATVINLENPAGALLGGGS
ncbi:MAG: hypothetical protein PVJ49_16655 [Acidobacteriota bacterium]|jgi:hypothetical protein